jgi:hypothetical protein
MSETVNRILRHVDGKGTKKLSRNNKSKGKAAWVSRKQATRGTALLWPCTQPSVLFVGGILQGRSLGSYSGVVCFITKNNLLRKATGIAPCSHKGRSILGTQNCRLPACGPLIVYTDRHNTSDSQPRDPNLAFLSSISIHYLHEVHKINAW